MTTEYKTKRKMAAERAAHCIMGGAMTTGDMDAIARTIEDVMGEVMCSKCTRSPEAEQVLEQIEELIEEDERLDEIPPLLDKLKALSPADEDEVYYRNLYLRLKDRGKGAIKPGDVVTLASGGKAWTVLEVMVTTKEEHVAYLAQDTEAGVRTWWTGLDALRKVEPEPPRQEMDEEMRQALIYAANKAMADLYEYKIDDLGDHEIVRGLDAGWIRQARSALCLWLDAQGVR